jgi:hypothetical protein
VSQVQVTSFDRQVTVTETVNQPVQTSEQPTAVLITETEVASVVITPAPSTATVGEKIIQSIVIEVPSSLPTEVVTPGPQGPSGESIGPLSTTFSYTGDQLTSTSNAVFDKTFTYNPDGTIASIVSTKLGVSTTTTFTYSNGKLVSTSVV